MDSKTIGILGGGQLGRMIVEAAHRLNIKTVILDAPQSPAKQINALDEHVDGSFTDYESIAKLAEKVDILTVEIEHVDVDALKMIQLKFPSIEIYPLPDTIKLIQDKYLQKEHLIQHGIAVTDSQAIAENTTDNLLKIGQAYGYPYMLKSRTLAYDGRGNFVVKDESYVEKALKF